MVRITQILQEASNKCKVNLPKIIGDNTSILNDLAIEVKSNTFDLGYDGSKVFKNNSQEYTVLVDLVSLSDYNEREGFKDALQYELAHEMTHPHMTHGLRWFEKATLQIDLLINQGVPPNVAIMDCVKNTVENIKIDSVLIKNPTLRRGFYYKQNDEFIKTYLSLNNSSINTKNNELDWISDFLGISRRALVCKRDKEINKLTCDLYKYNVTFRNQISDFFKTYRDIRLVETWLLLKQHFWCNSNELYYITKNIIEIAKLGIQDTISALPISEAELNS
jgi:hypothetical protein